MRRLRSVCVFTIFLLTGISGLVFAASSSAQLPAKESCPATLNGVNARYFMTPGTALEVPYDGYVVAAFNSDQKITGHQVLLSFAEHAAFRVFDASDDATSWSDTIQVSKYADYGVGLYEVRAETWGPGGCLSKGYVKVTGKSPLTTPVGAAGAAATGLGLVGMAGSAVSGMKKGPELAGKVPDGADIRYPPPTARRCFGLCAMNLVRAFLHTGAFMVSGAGTIGAPVVITPYLSLTSLIGSFLAGLGTLVLGQQYALFFPTVTLSLLWIAAWLAAGVVLTQLARLVAVRKANSILAARIAAQKGAPVSGEATDDEPAVAGEETREETGPEEPESDTGVIEP